MLVIDPTECIDCTLCEPECPANAIFSDSEIPQDQARFIELNKLYSKEWPWISETKNCAPNADQWNGIINKLDKISGYLSDDEFIESLRDPNEADLIIQTYKLTNKQILCQTNFRFG
jgi:ferredoxin